MSHLLVRRSQLCEHCDWYFTAWAWWLRTPCEHHRCGACGHQAHPSEEGCSAPNPFTGWCECESGTIGRGKPLLHSTRRQSR